MIARSPLPRLPLGLDNRDDSHRRAGTNRRAQVQQWGGPVQQIGVGDRVWIPPGVKHWHGGSPTQGMAHVAIAEAQDGRSVTWMEQVSDAQYRGR